MNSKMEKSQECIADGLWMPNNTEPFWQTRFNDKISREVCVVEITAEEYLYVEEAVENWWLNQKHGEWGEGLANNTEEGDGKKAQRIGLLGEVAFAKIFQVLVQVGYEFRGNDYDFDFLGETWEMKTALCNREAGLVRVISDTGVELPLSADNYIFAYLVSEDKEQKCAKIALVGTITKDLLQEQPIVPARKGFHQNREAPYDLLTPIQDLWNMNNAS